MDVLDVSNRFLYGYNSDDNDSPFTVGNKGWLDDILGGIGSSGGGIGGIASGAAAGAVAGPWGAALGAIAGLFGNVFQEGWSLSCIGKQAFDKGNFEEQMNQANGIISSINPNNIVSVQNGLNDLAKRASLSVKAVSNYKSSCSKNLRGKFGEFCQKAVNELLPHVNSTMVMKSENDQWEGQFSYPFYTVTSIKSGSVVNTNVPTGGSNNPNTPSGGFADIMQGFNLLSSYEQATLESYANENNLDLGVVANGFLGGSIKIVNGKIVWSASAGSGKDNQMMTYLIVGGGLLLAYKMFVKK
ncbi:hypothetical protein [Kaistella sp.]|uniref:hypothetical protein n=1 Tax=Kaistella sp. TaxID=2782235 RepID=UPI003C5B1323